MDVRNVSRYRPVNAGSGAVDSPPGGARTPSAAKLIRMTKLAHSNFSVLALQSDFVGRVLTGFPTSFATKARQDEDFCFY